MINFLMLVMCLFSESRSEGFDGMLGVANVINNRAEYHQMSYYDVILKPKQFSCFNNNWKVVNRDFEDMSAKKDIEALETAFKVALLVTFGIIEDNTDGSLYYVRTDCNPSWGRSMKIVKIIRNHKFMKEI